MKITKRKNQDIGNDFEFEYPKWPEDGNATLTCVEWENGDGFDVDMDGTKIELTSCELAALAKLHAETILKPLMN